MTRYEMLERIGVGGMAEIFRGRAVAGGGFEKPVAIKRILPDLSRDERFVKMLIAEANTLSELRHRNIVQIFDVGLGGDGQYFLVMEYVDGSDLAHLYDALEKRGKRLPAQLSVHIAAEVCDALDFAHRAKSQGGDELRIVHRDVSPSNVLLSHAGEVKLTDFGIAKRMEEVTGHHGVRGKYAYISPEQSRNQPVDARSDVFSLGIVLFELATGRRLFSSMADFDALQSVREGGMPSPRDYDPDMAPQLVSIIERATSRDPDKRFPTAANLGAALRDFRYSTLTSAGDPSMELARILAIARRSDDEFTHEPTVLRIETAAGFTGVGMESRLSSDVGFEEEETRAVGSRQLRALMNDSFDKDSSRSRARAAKFTDEPTQDVQIDQLLEVLPGSGPMAAAPLNLADEETHLLDTSGATPTQRVGDGPTPTSEQIPRPTLGAPMHLDTGAPLPVVRAPTPTVRDVFQRGELVDQGAMSTDAVERYEAGYFGMPRRRAVVVASVTALVLGISAFVVAGVLLGDGAPASPVALSTDAGVDVQLPRDEIQTSAADAGATARNRSGAPARAKPKPKAKPRVKPKPRAKPRAKPKARAKAKARAKKKKKKRPLKKKRSAKQRSSDKTQAGRGTKKSAKKRSPK